MVGFYKHCIWTVVVHLLPLYVRNGDSLVWRITIPYTPVELRGESNGEMICVRSKNHILLRFLWPPFFLLQYSAAAFVIWQIFFFGCSNTSCNGKSFCFTYSSTKSPRGHNFFVPPFYGTLVCLYSIYVSLDPIVPATQSLGLFIPAEKS